MPSSEPKSDKDEPRYNKMILPKQGANKLTMVVLIIAFLVTGIMIYRYATASNRAVPVTPNP